MQNFEQIYSQYRSQLLRFIQQRVRDPDVAEDVLHDVFVKIVSRWDSLREPARVTAWLYQVTRNAIVDRLRSGRSFETLPTEMVDDSEEPSAQTRLAGFLRPMIEALPQIYRDAVIFSDLDGLSLKQIAERERLSVSAMKSRVQRGRRLLEEMLRDCCAFEFSHNGGVIDFWPKPGSACRCSN